MFFRFSSVLLALSFLTVGIFLVASSADEPTTEREYTLPPEPVDITWPPDYDTNTTWAYEWNYWSHHDTGQTHQYPNTEIDNIVSFFWLDDRNWKFNGTKVAENTTDFPSDQAVLFSWWPHKILYKNETDEASGLNPTSGLTEDFSAIWWDNGTQEVYDLFDEFFADYKASGGRCDHFVLDFEQGFSNWANGYDNSLEWHDRGDAWHEAKWNIVQDDQRFIDEGIMATLEGMGYVPGRLNDTVYDWGNYATPASCKDNYLVWNSLMSYRKGEYTNDAVYDALIKHFPDATMSNYGNYKWDASLQFPGRNGHNTKHYGNGSMVGTHQSKQIYGALGQGIDNMGYVTPGKIYQRTPFNAMRYHSNTVKLMYLTDPNAPIAPWISYKTFSDDNENKKTYLNESDHYQENILHAGMNGADYFLYWNPNSTQWEDILVSNVLNELDEMIGYDVEKTPLTTDIYWDIPFQISGMEVGDYRAWRFTPDVDSEDGKNQTLWLEGDDIIFKTDGYTVLFEEGQIYRPSSTDAPLGWWVLQDKNSGRPYWHKATVPDIYNATPYNRSEGLMIIPTLSVDISDEDGDLMDLEFYTNASGIWTQIKVLSNIPNGTYTHEASELNEYDRKYYWHVKCHDDDGYHNRTFVFDTTTNLAPIVNFTVSPTNIYPQTWVWLNSTSTDPLGNLVSFEWNYGDGTFPETGTNVTHQFQSEGDFNVNLTVTDDGGVKRSMVKVVSVLNLAPDVSLTGDTDAAETERLYFTATGTDTYPDSTTLQYNFDFGDGNSTGWQSDSLADHSYHVSGSHIVTVRVRDDDLAEANASMQVNITNEAPDVEIFEPAAGASFNEDEEVEFDGIGYDNPSDTSTLEFRWDYGDGNLSTWSDTAEGIHSYEREGSYLARLWVRDNDLATDSDFVTLTINNVAPIAVLSEAGKAVYANETIEVNGTWSSDTPSDKDLLTFTWYYGWEGEDVTTAIGPFLSIDLWDFSNGTLNKTTNLTITLTVMDDDGATNTQSITYEVAPNITASQHNITPQPNGSDGGEPNGTNGTNPPPPPDGSEDGGFDLMAFSLFGLLIVIAIIIMTILIVGYFVISKRGPAKDIEEDWEDDPDPDIDLDDDFVADNSETRRYVEPPRPKEGSMDWDENAEEDLMDTEWEEKVEDMDKDWELDEDEYDEDFDLDESDDDPIEPGGSSDLSASVLQDHDLDDIDAEDLEEAAEVLDED